MALCAMARADSGAPVPDAPGMAGPPSLSPEAIQKRKEILEKIRQQRLHLQGLQGKNPSLSTFPHHGLAVPQGEPGVPPRGAVPQLNDAPTAGASSGYTPSDTSEPNNPYASIVARNVFGLNPIQVAQPDQDSGPPPPKITLTGITTILGPAEALYKVAGVVRDNKPPQDESYMLTEGEGQDDVDVVHIDVNKGLVTFNNHGVTQEIPLQAGTASGGGSEGGGPPPPNNPFMRRFGGPNPANMPPALRARFMQRFGNNGNNPNGNNNNFNPAGQFNGSYNNNNNNNTLNNNNGFTSNPSGLSGDDINALISAQKAAMQNDGDPNAPLMPNTPEDNNAGVKPDPSETGGSGDNEASR